MKPLCSTLSIHLWLLCSFVCGLLVGVLVSCFFVHISSAAAAPRPGEGPLSVSIEGPDRVSVLPSSTRSFICRVNTSAVIRWTHNGHDLPESAVVQDIGGYVSVLTITSLNADYAGVYVCMVHSQSGAFNARASIQVTFYGQYLRYFMTVLITSKYTPTCMTVLNCIVANCTEVYHHNYTVTVDYTHTKYTFVSHSLWSSIF